MSEQPLFSFSYERDRLAYRQLYYYQFYSRYKVPVWLMLNYLLLAIPFEILRYSFDPEFFEPMRLIISALWHLGILSAIFVSLGLICELLILLAVFQAKEMGLNM